MDGSNSEDWERAWLLDSLYVKEIEYQEMEFLRRQKPPAKITFVPSLKGIKARPKLLKAHMKKP